MAVAPRKTDTSFSRIQSEKILYLVYAILIATAPFPRKRIVLILSNRSDKLRNCNPSSIAKPRSVALRISSTTFSYRFCCEYTIHYCTNDKFRSKMVVKSYLSRNFPSVLPSIEICTLLILLNSASELTIE